MDISEQHWKRIRSFFGEASHATASLRRSQPTYCSFATVNEDGSPHVTPIGSLILREDKQGFYLEEFSRHMSRNLQRDQKVCVLLVQNSLWYWVKTIILGRLDHPCAVRLMGTVGKKREATLQEINAFQKPIRFLKIFRGYQPMWGVMKHGREIHFDTFEPIQSSIRELESI